MEQILLYPPGDVNHPAARFPAFLRSQRTMA